MAARWCFSIFPMVSGSCATDLAQPHLKRHQVWGYKIAVSVRVDGDVAIVAVADDGPGIRPHERDHIFTPSGRAHDVPSQPNSIGLGLTVSCTLARLMGGDLVYTYNGTSMFECELPLAPSRP